MLLGIEIGGTKLQLGVGPGDGSPPVALDRFDVEPTRGAGGILGQIQSVGRAADPAARRDRRRHRLRRAGRSGQRSRAEKPSHRRLAGFSARGLDAHGLGPAGALWATMPTWPAWPKPASGPAKEPNPVFYITVGTGIGGGLIVDGHVYRGSGLGAAEIGHLRPGLNADRRNKRSNRSPAAGALPPPRKPNCRGPCRIGSRLSWAWPGSPRACGST